MSDLQKIIMPMHAASSLSHKRLEEEGIIFISKEQICIFKGVGRKFHRDQRILKYVKLKGFHKD